MTGMLVRAFAINPSTRSTLYAGTDGGGVFDIEQVLSEPTATVTPTPPPMVCVGDCNSSHSVTVDEILTMVNIALGNADISTCIAGDANDDTKITVDEILTAVNNALNGCS